MRISFDVAAMGLGVHLREQVLQFVKWEWPPPRCIKINVDGSSCGNPGDAGFGGLLRGADGHWIMGFHGFIGVANSLLPELMAIRMGLCLAWDHGYRRVLCESDSLEAIRCVNSKAQNHVYGAVIMDIQQWLCREWTVSLSHVLREANACADYLANEGARQHCRLIVLKDPLQGLLPLLHEDYKGTLFMRL